MEKREFELEGRKITMYGSAGARFTLIQPSDEQDLSGMETFFFHDMALVQIKDAHLGGEDQPSVIHHIISGRTQAVTVKDGTHYITV